MLKIPNTVFSMGFVQIGRVLLNFYRFRHDVGSARDTGGKINLIYLDFAKFSSQQTRW